MGGGHAYILDHDIQSGLYNTSTLEYINDLYRYDGTNWVKISKSPSYTGNLYINGEMTSTSGKVLNPAYSSTYFYWEFQGYVRCSSLF